MKKYGLPTATVERIHIVFARFAHIERAVLYGSRAKGNFKPGSDIDLTLFGEKLDSSQLGDIAEELDDLLLPYTIDLSLYAELNHAKLREHIDRVGVTFYERRSAGDHLGVVGKEGWVEKPLGQCFKLRSGDALTRKAMIDGEYSVFGGNGIAGVHNEFNLSGDNVVVGRVGALCGNARHITENIWLTDNAFRVVDFKQEFDHAFLTYLLNFNNLRSLARQSAQPVISNSSLKDLPLKFPEISEQRRIVGILDEAFEGIATAKANAEKNLQNARAIFESHLNSVFYQRGEGWVERPLADICDIKHGFAFKSEYFTDHGEYVLLTPGNFYESGGYRDRGDKQKYYVGEIPNGFILSQGNLLVAMTEQAAGLLGSPILVPESGEFLHNQRLGLIIPKADVPWVNEFYFHFFNTKKFRKSVHDSGSGQKVRHTSPKKIGAVVASFPNSVLEQRKIASELDSLHEDSKGLESIYQRKLSALDELKKSLLHQAFSGEL
jgi:type I restriction enzyme, S subunit